MAQNTLQSIFDRVANHLLSQNERSWTPKGCAYRGPGNLKCAVGCLIADEHYSENLEGAGVLADRVQLAVAKSLELRFLHEDLSSLLGSLQNIHDSLPPENWPERLEVTARAYDLKFKISEELKGANLHLQS